MPPPTTHLSYSQEDRRRLKEAQQKLDQLGVEVCDRLIGKMDDPDNQTPALILISQLVTPAEPPVPGAYLPPIMFSRLRSKDRHEFILLMANMMSTLDFFLEHVSTQNMDPELAHEVAEVAALMKADRKGGVMGGVPTMEDLRQPKGGPPDV